jgi:filamentous hemagglutinin family protein
MATVVSNPYGPLTIDGATLAGDAIYDFDSTVVIQLGAIGGLEGSFIELDFQGFNIGPGTSVTIVSGAPGQTVFIYNADSTSTSVGGVLRALGGNGEAAPILLVNNPNGITIVPGGNVTSPSGLTLDTLGSAWTLGQPLVNNGFLDGGVRTNLYTAQVTGSGLFKGDIVFVATFGNANNPVNGAHFLANGLALAPSNGDSVSLVINDYGSGPQFLNFAISGHAAIWSPSSWPSQSTVPPNNLTVSLGSILPPGTPDPVYGGGSLIVQTTGSLSLISGASNDFVFPGGIVFKAGGALDLNGVVVSQGWTATGQLFQGIFFESPYIVSSAGTVPLLSNDLNWINFSSMPQAHFRTWRLVRAADGSTQYVPADSLAPHLNTFSLEVEAAATGACWICLVNSAPINVQ